MPSKKEYIPSHVDANFLRSVELVLTSNKRIGVKPSNMSSLSKLITGTRNSFALVKSGNRGIPHKHLEKFAALFGFNLEDFYVKDHSFTYDGLLFAEKHPETAFGKKSRTSGSEAENKSEDISLNELVDNAPADIELKLKETFKDSKDELKALYQLNGKLQEEIARLKVKVLKTEVERDQALNGSNSDE